MDYYLFSSSLLLNGLERTYLCMSQRKIICFIADGINERDWRANSRNKLGLSVPHLPHEPLSSEFVLSKLFI